MILPQSIMILEDELITKRYLTDLLTHFNVSDIVCYDNALDAKNAFKKNSYEMVLVDININGPIDGISFSRELLQTQNVPIVFITAHSDAQTLKEVVELAPFGFITKPFTSKDIEVTLQIAYQRFLSYKNVMARSSRQNEHHIVQINQKFYYEKGKGLLYHNGETVKLNQKQKKLIEILVKNIDNVVSYETLSYEIWGSDMTETSSLRTLVYTTRKMLPELSISAYSKMGYVLETDKD